MPATRKEMSIIAPGENSRAPIAPEGVRRLVERFEHNLDSYTSGKYNETQVRREFVDPLFEFLAWDVSNSRGYAEAYKDVVHEDAVKIGGRTKAPDYAFRIGGIRKFFVETKAPHRNLKNDPNPAFQLRRYAWSAKLQLSILTDFEEFSVYDTRIRPAKTDKAATARILYLRYTDYISRWGEIAKLFSRDAILTGAFDAYAESNKTKRGTAEVDESFLHEIESWREALARNIALRNSDLSLRLLNTAVQRTIDRIVFLRICEDRGIEPYGQLAALLNGGEVYERLSEVFVRADERYNSGLFHFREEPGRSEPADTQTLSLTIDDRVLRDIISHLYYPDSPYEFSVFSADILGQVYEQFLGKVIRLTRGHQAKVEEKPDVRKSGGIYYTPTGVVDYLVRRTVKVLLEEAGTPRKAAALRILDPACGSGSFLIRVYQLLLDWHLAWYQENGIEKHAKGRNARVYEGPGREWRLTTAERKRILTNSVYGVDIDPQAVEVTKLSLLLKVLEGESSDRLESQLTLFRERALPDLGSNIKCGNSLVGTDFFSGRQSTLFDEDELYRINAFDWKTEFLQVFDDGGFSAVIGNPPYLSFSGRQAIQLNDELREYYARIYPGSGWQTSHGYFVAKAHSLTSRMVGLIVPDQVGHLEGYESTRAAATNVSTLVDVRYWGENVFPGVVTPALTFVTDKAYRGSTRIETADSLSSVCKIRSGSAWTAASPHADLIEKLHAQAASLDSCFADPGVHTGNCSKKLILPVDEAPPDSVPVLEGKQVGRYICREPTKVLRLSYEASKGEYFRIRPVERYRNAPFVIRQTANQPIVGPRHYADYFRNSLLALYPPTDGRDVRFVVAVLNSRLIRYVYRVSVVESAQKAFPQVKVGSLRSLPVRAVDQRSERDKHIHDSLVARVHQLIELHTLVESTETSHDRQVLNRRIIGLDREIDQLVERMYDLSESEVSQVVQYLGETGGEA